MNIMFAKVNRWIILYAVVRLILFASLADCRESQAPIAPEEIESAIKTAANLIANCSKIVDEHKIKFIVYNWDTNQFMFFDITTLDLRDTSYDPKNVTKVLFHPQFTDYTSMLPIFYAYRNLKKPFNIILVDFHNYAACGLAGDSFPKIVPIITKFYTRLYEYGTTPDTLHVVACGLGCHIAGPGARALYDKRPYRVTGLDPGNDFQIASGYMGPNDGRFVDITHTSSGQSGTPKLVGTVDFEVNGGTFQPYCNLLDDYCNHIVPIKYYAESINEERKFCSAPCSLYYSNAALNESVEILWGEYVPIGTEGLFCFNTNADPPFAQGVIDRPPNEAPSS